MLWLPTDAPVSRVWTLAPPAPVARAAERLRGRAHRAPRVDPGELRAACAIVRQLAAVEWLTLTAMLAFGKALGTLRAAEDFALAVLDQAEAGSPDLAELAEEIEDALERAGLGAGDA